MHCARCKSTMLAVEIHKEQNSEQIRFECPLCGSIHLSSRPLGATPQMESKITKLHIAGSLAMPMRFRWS